MVSQSSRNGRAKKPAVNPRITSDMVYNTLMANYRRQQNLFGGPFAGPPLQSRGLYGQSLNEKREIRLDAECGYPSDEDLTPEYYRRAYHRWGVASRVVNIWPDECWTEHPEVYESETEEKTPFEVDWAGFVDRLLVFHYLHRIDRLSGIGRYGVLFLGLNDKGGRLDHAPPGINPQTGKPIDGRPQKRELRYIRAFDESIAQIHKSEGDRRSPRFGEPVQYRIQLADEKVTGPGPTESNDPSESGGTKSVTVHWTRCIHVCDNRTTSEIYGRPRLEGVINDIHDLRKVGGGSGEMFWKGGFPGYAFKTYPDLIGGSDFDQASLQLTMKAYQEGTSRFLATVGGEWDSLQPQVASPDKHLEWIIKLIAMTIDVPMRILLGSEAGQLASTQDDAAWRTRCSGRQKKYLEPLLLRPFINRCVDLGCLISPKKKEGLQYFVDWKDLRALSDDARVGVALKKMQALMTYATGNVNYVIPERFMLTLIMGYTEDQADAIIAELKKNKPKPIGPPPEPTATLGKPPAGGRNNRTPARGAVGKPAGTRPKGSQSKAQGRPSTSQKKPRRN